jgi:RNA polymerase sigma-70 factor (ECF subfamily)
MMEQSATLLEFDKRLRMIDGTEFVPAPSITEILAKTDAPKEPETDDRVRSAEAVLRALPVSADSESVSVALRNLLAAAYDKILRATASPTTEEFDKILAALRRVSAVLGSWKLDGESAAYASGQLDSLAEFCEVCRRQKVPFETAEVLVRRKEARAVLDLVQSTGSLTPTAIAESLDKASQNLHATLKEMTSTGLLRRDLIGQATLYSATALGRLALRWSEKQPLSKRKEAPEVTRNGTSPKLAQRPNDEMLVRRAQSGDRSAFEELVRHYDQAVLRLAVHLTGSEHDAQDVYQDAFLRAYKNIGSFRFESSFYTWIYRIVTNLCLDHLRKQRERVLASEDSDQSFQDSEKKENEPLPDLVKPLNPERPLIQRELGAKIARALDGLTPRERQVFELRHYQGLKVSAIGEVLGTTEETARSVLFLATQKLRHSLTDATGRNQKK